MNMFRADVDSLPTRGVHAEGHKQAVERRGYLLSGLTAVACMTASPSLAEIGYGEVNQPAAHVWKTFTPFVPAYSAGVTDCRLGMSSWDHGRDVSPPAWVGVAQKGVWVQQASERIDYLAAKREGWKGDGSLPPSPAAISDSYALVQKLRSEGCNSEPMIGADDDGELVFFWKSDRAVASISVEGDGSYSIHVKSEAGSLTADGCRIADPLPRALVDAFEVLDAKRA